MSQKEARNSLLAVWRARLPHAKRLINKESRVVPKYFHSGCSTGEPGSNE
jgi:hypothetical protein